MSETKPASLKETVDELAKRCEVKREVREKREAHEHRIESKHHLKGSIRDGVTLSFDECELIHTYLNSLGEDATAAALRVHRVTIFRALAGRRIRQSTAECIRSRLRALKLEDSESQNGTP